MPVGWALEAYFSQKWWWAPSLCAAPFQRVLALPEIPRNWLCQAAGIAPCKGERLHTQCEKPTGVYLELCIQFVDFGGLRTALQSGSRQEVAFQPPLRSGPPRDQPGEYWKGSLYFDTSTNKLRVNTGSMWVDLH